MGRAAGIAPSDLSCFAGYGQSPNALAIWGMAGSGRAERFLSDLAERGFAPLDGLEGVLADGPPGRFDLTRRTPWNPWNGDLEASSVVATRGGVLVQAATTEPVALALASRHGLPDNPAFDAALAGIEHVARDGAVVQAGVFSTLPALPALPPSRAAEMMLTDPTWFGAAGKAMKESAPAADTGPAADPGFPLWRGHRCGSAIRARPMPRSHAAILRGDLAGRARADTVRRRAGLFALGSAAGAGRPPARRHGLRTRPDPVSAPDRQRSRPGSSPATPQA